MDPPRNNLLKLVSSDKPWKILFQEKVNLTHSLSGFNFLNSYGLTSVGSGGNRQRRRRYRLDSLYATTACSCWFVVRVATAIGGWRPFWRSIQTYIIQRDNTIHDINRVIWTKIWQGYLSWKVSKFTKNPMTLDNYTQIKLLREICMYTHTPPNCILNMVNSNGSASDSCELCVRGLPSSVLGIPTFYFGRFISYNNPKA